jgi:hypothetical protein
MILGVGIKVKLSQIEKNAIFIFDFIVDWAKGSGTLPLKKHVIFSS